MTTMLLGIVIDNCSPTFAFLLVCLVFAVLFKVETSTRFSMSYYTFPSSIPLFFIDASHNHSSTLSTMQY